jgi:hypothetical protein
MILVYVQVLHCQRKTEQPGWQFSDRENVNEKSCFLPLSVNTEKTKDRIILTIRDDRMCSGAHELKTRF